MEPGDQEYQRLFQIYREECDEHIQPPPLSLEPERALFIRGEYLIERRPLSLLDFEKIIAAPRFAGQE